LITGGLVQLEHNSEREKRDKLPLSYKSTKEGESQISGELIVNDVTEGKI